MNEADFVNMRNVALSQALLNNPGADTGHVLDRAKAFYDFIVKGADDAKPEAGKAA